MSISEAQPNISLEYLDELDDMVELTWIDTQLGKVKVNRYTWSALLENSCELCASLDGLTVSANDPNYAMYQPPLHARGRCLWLFSTTTDPNPPPLKWKDPSKELLREFAPHLAMEIGKEAGLIWGLDYLTDKEEF